MLDTSSTANAEYPLFGTMPSLTIQRPLPTESYSSWSDFPVAVVEEETYKYNNGSCFQQQHNDNDNDSFSSSSSSFCSLSTSSSSSTLSSSSSSTASMNSMNNMSMSLSSEAESEADAASSETETKKRTATTASPSSSSSSLLRRRRRSVRFAPSLEVRTYSLVLGDHPLCDDGLAIELGWEYDEKEGRKIDLRIHEDCKLLTVLSTTYTSSSRGGIMHHCHGHSHNNYCSRRSYLQRKQLLLNVAGCTAHELEQRTESREEERRRVNRLRQEELLLAY